MLGLFAFPLILGGLFWALSQQGFFSLKQLDVSVENLLNQAHYTDPLVAKVSEMHETYKDKSLWSLDLVSMKLMTTSLPWLEEISYHRRWPNRLEVKVKLKEVALILNSRRGKFHPVLTDGSALEALPIKQVPDLPILRGESFENSLPLRKTAIALIREIPSEGALNPQNISEIHFDSKEGFWMTMIEEGLKVKIGFENFKLKSERVSQVLDYMRVHSMQARVIDADLSKKVVVKLRKDP